MSGLTEEQVSAAYADRVRVAGYTFAAAQSWFFVYDVNNGNALVADGSVIDQASLPANYHVATLSTGLRPDGGPDWSQQQWDAPTQTLVARVAPAQTWQGPPAGSSYKFTSYKPVNNPPAIEFTFWGPVVGGKNDYVTVTATDSELAAASTQAARIALVKAKLQRVLLAANIASVLDPLIGQSVTI